jgi:hypothetical protein
MIPRASLYELAQRPGGVNSVEAVAACHPSERTDILATRLANMVANGMLTRVNESPSALRPRWRYFGDPSVPHSEAERRVKERAQAARIASAERLKNATAGTTVPVAHETRIIDGRKVPCTVARPILERFAVTQAPSVFGGIGEYAAERTHLSEVYARGRMGSLYAPRHR